MTADIHTTVEIADRLRRLIRRAERFGHDRARILEEIAYMAVTYERQVAEFEEESARYEEPVL